MTGQELWELLPGALRRGDEEAGGVLRAVVEMLAGPADLVAHDIDAMADDWFIETCADWVVSYLGDLVGVEELHPLGGAIGFSSARGWPTRSAPGAARARPRCSRTSPARPPAGRPGRSSTSSCSPPPSTSTTSASVPRRRRRCATPRRWPWSTVRSTAPPTPSPSDRSARTAAATTFRTSASTSGPSPATRSTARRRRRWRTRPTGAGSSTPSATTTPWPVPASPRPPSSTAPSRRTCPRRCAGARSTTSSTHAAPTPARSSSGSSPGDPAFTVFMQEGAGVLTEVDLDLLEVCDLSAWERPTGTMVRVDPVLGRVAVSPARVVERAAVSWSYAFGADIGAGPYPRRPRPGEAVDTTTFDFQIGVSATDDPVPSEVVATLAEAVAAWHDLEATNAGRRVRNGRIVVMDSHRYVEDLTVGRRRRGHRRPGQPAVIVAARGPNRMVAGPDDRARSIPQGVRPCLVGVCSRWSARAPATVPASVEIDGLLRHRVAHRHLAGLARRRPRRPPAGPRHARARGRRARGRGEGTNGSRSTCGAACAGRSPSPVKGPACASRTRSSTTPLRAPRSTSPTPPSRSAASPCSARRRRATSGPTTRIFDDVVTVARRQDGCLRFS